VRSPCGIARSARQEDRRYRLRRRVAFQQVCIGPDRLRIVAVADVCPAADRACVNVHHVPLVVSARPPDLLDRAKHLLVSANVGEPQEDSAGPRGLVPRSLGGMTAAATWAVIELKKPRR
jgi:hypothetical protein